MLDKNSQQLYRYSRAPGGFGIPKEWLEEEIDMSSAIDLDVSEFVYIAYENSLIQKFSQNKKVAEFHLEENFVVNKIRTEANSNKIFAFDKEQGKIVELSEEGEIIKTFQDKKFKDAEDFSINFENQQVFVVTKDNTILTFDY